MKKVVLSLITVFALSFTVQSTPTRTWEVEAADGSAVRYSQLGPTVMIVAIRPCAYCVWQIM